MNKRVVPTTQAGQEVQEGISALTTELITMLNARAPTYSRQVVLMGLLNTFFVAAEEYGEMDVAIAAARGNADEIERIRASCPTCVGLH
jgi:hypothetical protein